MVEKSKKIISFIDLCGHEKYFKTTLFGLAGMFPDYAMIVVGSNMGVQRMTREHLCIVLALKIPFYVVLTKIDICPENVYKETLETVVKILKSPSVNRLPIIIKTVLSTFKTEEAVKTSQCIRSDRICPIFSVSNVTGEGIPDLIVFLSGLHCSNKQKVVVSKQPQPDSQQSPQSPQ